MSVPDLTDILLRLDRLLGATDPRSHLDALRCLVADPIVRARGLNDHRRPALLPVWLELGAFAAPPPGADPETHNAAYAAAAYLFSVSRDVPPPPAEPLAAAIRQLQPSPQPTIHEYLARAALALHPAALPDVASAEQDWLRCQGRNAKLDDGEAWAQLVRAAAGVDCDTAQGLLAELLALFEPTPEDVRRIGDVVLSSGAATHFDRWGYATIARTGATALLECRALEVVRLLCELLDQANRLDRFPHEPDPPYDGLDMEIPALDESRRSEPLDARAHLALTLRDMAVDALQRHAVGLDSLLAELRPFNWLFHERLSLHLLRLAAPCGKENVRTWLINREWFEGRRGWQEYARLLAERFGDLPPTDQATIWRWIEGGPDVSGYAAAQRQWWGQEPTAEAVERYRRGWQRRYLAVLEQHLDEEGHRRLEALEREFGDVVNEGWPWFLGAGTQRHEGPEAPEWAADLPEHDIAQVLRELDTFEPDPGFWGPSREGVARRLTDAVKAKPTEYSEAAQHFADKDATYVRAYLRGLSEAVTAQAAIDWSSLLRLGHAIAQYDREIAGRQRPSHDEDADWCPAWGELLRLIEVSLDKNVLPTECGAHAWGVISRLMRSAWPAEEEEADWDATWGWYGVAINATRSQAVGAAVSYGLWLHRQQEGGGPLGPELDDLCGRLEEHLDPALDPSLAVRAVFGRWFPWLGVIDAERAARWADRIFPTEDAHLAYWDAAWSSYVGHCRAYDEDFHLLQRQYEYALLRLVLDRHALAHLLVRSVGGPVRVGVPADHVLVPFARRLHDAALAEPSQTWAEVARRLEIPRRHLARYGIGPNLWARRVVPEHDSSPSDPPEHEKDLGQHIVEQYWRGNVGLEQESLLARFFAACDDALRIATLAFTGEALQGTDREDPIGEPILRLQGLWDWRYPDASDAERAAFGHWFSAKCLDREWALDRLRQVLSATGRVDEPYAALRCLADDADRHLPAALACLSAMLQGTFRSDTPTDDVSRLLTLGLDAGPPLRQQAEDMVRRLVDAGWHHYRRLLRR